MAKAKCILARGTSKLQLTYLMAKGANLTEINNGKRYIQDHCKYIGGYIFTFLFSSSIGGQQEHTQM